MDFVCQLTDKENLSCCSIHPEHLLRFSRDLTEVYCHLTPCVVIYHEVVFPSCCDEAVVACAVLTTYDRLVGNSIEERECKHEVLKVFHLRESRVFKSLIPRLHISCITIACSVARLEELHNSVMTVGVTARASEDRPISVTANVAIHPSRLVSIVKTLWDIFIAWFCIEHGLNWLICPCGVNIHPVVFLGIVRDRVVFVSHSLTITAVSRLEGVEVHPFCFAEPFCAGISATRVIGHDMVLVY